MRQIRSITISGHGNAWMKKTKSKRKSFLAQLPDLRKLYDTHENSNSVRDTTVTLLLLSPSILTSRFICLIYHLSLSKVDLFHL